MFFHRYSWTLGTGTWCDLRWSSKESCLGEEDLALYSREPVVDGSVEHPWMWPSKCCSLLTLAPLPGKVPLLLIRWVTQPPTILYVGISGTAHGKSDAYRTIFFNFHQGKGSFENFPLSYIFLADVMVYGFSFPGCSEQVGARPPTVCM